MKKKVSLAFVLAMCLLLVTAAALAAAILGGKDVVNEKIAPMAQQNQSQLFTASEVEEILSFAREHGIALDDGAMRRIRGQGSCFKEELAMLFAKEQLGFYPGTWSVEDQLWYAQFWQRLHPDLLVENTVPMEGELSQQAIEERAANYIRSSRPDAPDVLDAARYRILRSFTAVRENPWHVQRQWSLYFEPLNADDPEIHMTLDPQGNVLERTDSSERWRTASPDERAQMTLDRFSSLYGNIYSSSDAWSQRDWQQLRERLAALGATPGKNRTVDYVLAQQYDAPANAIPREQAVNAAAEAVSAAQGVAKEDLLDTARSKFPPETAVYALYVEAQGQRRWKVSFAFDYLAEVDAMTGQVALTDVYSPGNDHNRRYVLDALIPEARRAYATPAPREDAEDMDALLAKYPPRPYYTADLAVAPESFWQRMDAVGLTTGNVGAFLARLQEQYGHDPRYWPIAEQAADYLRENRPGPGDVFPGLPEAGDMQQAAALERAAASLKDALGSSPDAKLAGALKPVVSFAYNLYAPGSRTWQIDFVHPEGRNVRDVAYVAIDAVTGQLLYARPADMGRDVQAVPSAPEAADLWSTMGADGRPAVWRNPVAPERYWAYMEAHYNDRATVEQAIAAWQRAYAGRAYDMPAEARAVISLWRDQDLSVPWMREHIDLNGLPGEGDLSREQAEQMAWDALIQSGAAYTEADRKAARASCSFLYTDRYDGVCIWQVEFLDSRTGYQTGIGMVKLDGRTGRVIELSAETSNG